MDLTSVLKPQENSVYDRNRKLFTAIALQAASNHQARFVDPPSSIHDSRLYSPVCYFLLGHEGYPCLERPLCLIKLYKQPAALLRRLSA